MMSGISDSHIFHVNHMKTVHVVMILNVIFHSLSIKYQQGSSKQVKCPKNMDKKIVNEN